ITATGVKDILVGRHFDSMKDGAVFCNTGHYDCEINIPELEERAANHRTIRPNCEEYLLSGNRRVYLLAQGRLVNLAAAEGHPSEVMDMSFANQFMSQLRLVKVDKGEEIMERGKVYDIPVEQDQYIAGLKLQTNGVSIDALTEEQIAYAMDYAAGT
ncbi:MAG TPA: adenosylhomocysteinase, partial [Candidatus Kapabacteria bacterium]|nr:adenosylhomocysteinase [Candidatus Kapabacteria bacterium]